MRRSLLSLRGGGEGGRATRGRPLLLRPVGITETFKLMILLSFWSEVDISHFRWSMAIGWGYIVWKWCVNHSTLLKPKVLNTEDIPVVGWIGRKQWQGHKQGLSLFPTCRLGGRLERPDKNRKSDTSVPLTHSPSNVYCDGFARAGNGGVICTQNHPACPLLQ